MAGLTHVSPSVEAAVVPAAPKQRFSPGRDALRRFRRHAVAAVSVVVLGLLALAILIGPWLWRVPINEIDFTARLATPSWDHPFGTDDLGQDLLARMSYGGRISLAENKTTKTNNQNTNNNNNSIAGASMGPVDAALMWVTDL